jgi:hypothetical protein
MPIPSAATLYINGTAMGHVVGLKGSLSAGSPVDITAIDSPVVGTGAQCRVVRQYDCALVEPGECSAEVVGPSAFSYADVGVIGTVAFNIGGFTFSGQAYLSSIDSEARVGDLVRSSVRFQFTGF